ncbi:STAS domain-containing protein [bacterium]|nr:STAS domain-containing protein [bacterium]
MEYQTIKVTEHCGYQLVTVLESRIYLTVTEVFKEELMRVIENGAHRLVIDMGTVAVMNSTGLGILILARSKVEKHNGVVHLARLQPLLMDIVKRMKLDTLFQVFASIEEACASE